MKAVRIEWIDAEGCDEWLDEKDIPPENPPVTSIGILIKSTPKNILISHSYDSQNKKWGGYLKIPKKNIKSCKITEIKL